MWKYAFIIIIIVVPFCAESKCESQINIVKVDRKYKTGYSSFNYMHYTYFSNVENGRIIEYDHDKNIFRPIAILKEELLDDNYLVQANSSMRGDIMPLAIKSKNGGQLCLYKIQNSKLYKYPIYINDNTFDVHKIIIDKYIAITQLCNVDTNAFFKTHLYDVDNYKNKDVIISKSPIEIDNDNSIIYMTSTSLIRMNMNSHESEILLHLTKPLPSNMVRSLVNLADNIIIFGDYLTSDNDLIMLNKINKRYQILSGRYAFVGKIGTRAVILARLPDGERVILDDQGLHELPGGFYPFSSKYEKNVYTIYGYTR